MIRLSVFHSEAISFCEAVFHKSTGIYFIFAPQGQKNPPRVFPGRCLEYRRPVLLPYLFHQVVFGIPAEGLELFFAALADDPQGAAEIQAEHFHEALGVDLVPGIPDGDIIGTIGSQGHKMLDILNGTESDLKFQHFYPS